VNSSGTDPDGERFNYLDSELRKMNAAYIDEHYYRRPEWFLQNATRYDNYPREGSKIFAGEYAAQTDRGASMNNKNNWRGALAEAAFMTGLERNAAVVEMASYAPLFAHAEGWQWKPDLIWVNNLQSYGTPNYYVQQLFAKNKGTHEIPVTANSEVLAGKDSLYACAALDTATGEVIIKLVNASAKAVSRSVILDGVKKIDPSGKLIQLQHANLDAENTFEQPLNVAPVEKEIKVRGRKLQLGIPAWSFSVIRLKIK
jgi:alpha-L-arabinofuranosidase